MNESTSGVTVEQWRERGRRLEVGGRRLFVADSAPGDDRRASVLMLHGFPTAGWDWHKLWPRLAGRYRLIAPDLLGFGFSEKPRRHEYSIHEQADLVEALLAELQPGVLHVLAHDYGDTVAQELLARENAQEPGERRWRSLSLLNGGLFPETHRARLAQKALAGPLGALVVRLMSRRTLERNIQAIFSERHPPSREDLDGFWALIEEEGGRYLAHRLIRYMHDRRVHRERWVRALREAVVPVQLINGSLDPVSGEHMVARYRELMGELMSDPELDREIIELADVGHYPQTEAPERVAGHYLAFLDRVEAANAV